ncbi:MAG: peptidase C25, partial [Candidatus Thermoplasmatota archaeon]|nr:peptidase C25 [Candidatus Thermoplasmatota archaeon]
MKKNMSIILVFILFLSGIGSAAVHQQHSIQDQIQVNRTLNFPPVSLADASEEYVELNLDQGFSYMLHPGAPILPKKNIQFELPFGVTDISIDVMLGSIEEEILEKQIQPAPAIQSFNPSYERFKKPVKNQAVYNSNIVYPDQWYSSNVVCGLNDNSEHATIITVQIYPVRYQPKANVMFQLTSADVKVTYQEPEDEHFVGTDDYDLVIIAPEIFTDALRFLVDHKNNMGIETFVKTTEEIYNEYDGVDKPEQIKYFIKDAVETQ